MAPQLSTRSLQPSPAVLLALSTRRLNGMPSVRPSQSVAASESRRDRLVEDALTGLINAVYMVSFADAAGVADEKAEG